MSHSENSEDLELFHFGVKGMRWGVSRKDTDGDGRVNGPAPGAKGGKGSSGGGAKGVAGKVGAKIARAKAKDNDDTIDIHTKYRDNTGGKVMSALSFADRKILGQKNYEKWHNMQIDALKEQNDRIRSGKTTIADKLDIALNTPLYQIVKA